MIVAADAIATEFGPRAASRVAALVGEEPGATVLGVFNRPHEGIETRIVGGAVRNALADRAPGDIDCATTATPDQVFEIARETGLRAVPTGVEHGTVTVIAGGHPVELTTLRQDVETHGRHATVAFGTDWDVDARRRDFTVNALYVDVAGNVHDPVGGGADIADKRLRFIGSAPERIREDYLRTLRFFRFLARFGGEPDGQALDAMMHERLGLRQLSAERVRKEVMLLLDADDPVPALTLMQTHGLLTMVLGSAPVVPRVARLLRLESTAGLERDALRRFMALALHSADDAQRLQDRLRLSNEEADRLKQAATGWWTLSPQIGAIQLKGALHRLGHAAFTNRLAFSWLHTGQDSPDEAWREVFALPGLWTPPAFPVSGDDLKAAGIAPGPAIGEALARLEEIWIESDFTLGRDDLLKTLED